MHLETFCNLLAQYAITIPGCAVIVAGLVMFAFAIDTLPHSAAVEREATLYGAVIGAVIPIVIMAMVALRS